MSGCLPEDVIVDLLSRLPVKSLLRLRCVSKQWLNLISSTSPPVGSVKHLHDHGNPRNTPFLFIWINNCSRIQYDICSPIFLNSIRMQVVDIVAERVHNEFNFDISGPYLNHVICCRDLVCFIGTRIYVCNPSTKELVQVPNCNDYKYGWFTLGYLPSTKQYKFVRSFKLHVDDRYPPDSDDDCDDEDCEMGCEIFTITDGGRVSSGSWRVTRNLPCMNLFGDGVCVNGVISWLVSFYEKKNYNHKLMLSFDLDREEYEMFSCPEPCPSLKHGIGYLLELKGLLWLVHHVNDGESIHIKTWFLNNQNDHDWVVGYNINVAFVHDCLKLQAYNVADDDNEELVFISKRSGVWYYNIRTQSFRSLEKLENVTLERLQWGVHYYDSFFSLGSV